MTRWAFVSACIALAAGHFAHSQPRNVPLPSPDQFLIGRHTSFDFGPPSDFYEVFSVHSGDKGTSIERITVTPLGLACIQPAAVQVSTGSLSESVADLLGKTNPCTIPEKELRRELKRKKGLVYSFANVLMQVQCGAQDRLIRMEILDRDMFDRAPKTPEHTSWTMALLARLDRAVGDGPLQRPIFAVSEPSALPAAESKSKALLADLSGGKFDMLFEGAPDKPSELYREAQKSPPPGPSVHLLSSSPFRPVSYALPKYTPLAFAARIESQVTFTLDVSSDGSSSNLRIQDGHVLLRKVVESEVANWKFPREAVGQQVQAVIEFKTNCPRAK